MRSPYDKLPITRFFTRDFESVAPETPATEAAALVGKSRDHVVLVIDAEKGKLKGIITATDLKGLQNAKTAAELGSRNVYGIRSDAKLGHLKAIMTGNIGGVPVSAVPVVDRNDRVVGLATRELIEKKLGGGGE